MENEKRLIDAKAFHYRVSQHQMTELFPNWKELPEEVQEMLCKHGKHLEMLLETEPSVDAVEVVRCKNCEYRKKDDVGRNYCGLGDFYCGDTDYCSRGKRMVSLEDIVDLDAQTKANNEAMRKVIDFIAGERKDNE